MVTSIKERIARYRRFYSAKKGLMTIVQAPSSADRAAISQSPRFDSVDWSSEPSVRNYARIEAENFLAATAGFETLDDDTVPILQVLAGTGMIAAAFVKDPVLHQESDTNYLVPPIPTWDVCPDRIGFDPDNLYYRAQMFILREYIDRFGDRRFILPFTHFGPLDLVNQFRGNDIFYDFSESPEELRALLSRSTDAILELEAHVRRNHMAGYEPEGMAVGGWFPAGTYLSCDIGDMISGDLLRAFELPYVERILSKWGGAFMHHHELGLHQIPTWTGCAGLSVQFLNRDPNTRHLGDMADEGIIAHSRRLPISFLCTADEYVRNCDRWAEGRFIIAVDCGSRKEAEELVRLAEKFRPY